MTANYKRVRFVRRRWCLVTGITKTNISLRHRKYLQSEFMASDEMKYDQSFQSCREHA